MNEHVSLEM